MTHGFKGRTFTLVFVSAIALMLSGCLGGGDNDKGMKKSDAMKEEPAGDGKWKVPTGADPQY